MSGVAKELSSICTQVYSGGTPASKNEAYYGGEIPWLRTQEVTFNRIKDTGIKITEAGLNNSAAKWVPENSVIVAMYGNSAGRVSINEIPLTTNQACCNLVIDPKVADYRYVFYALKQSYEALKGQSRGAAQNNLNASQVKAFKIPCPPVITQNAVCNILSAYDDLIENNRRRIQLLEQAARLLYKEWFVHLRFPGHEHIKIIEGVPEGWAKGTVSNLGQIITGKTPSTKTPENFGGDVLFVKTPDMHRSRIIVEAEESLSERGVSTQVNKTLPVGTILVACIGAKLGVVSITGRLIQTNQQINAVIPHKDYLRYFGLFALIDFKSQLEAMGGGATMPNVNKTKFSSIPVVIPPPMLLKEFDEFAKTLFQQMQLLHEQVSRLTKARDLLLPRLMNGDIAT